MTSHEFAQALKVTAEHMLSRTDVELEEYSRPHVYISFWDKEKFVAATRAMGSGTKSFQSDDLHFEPNGTCLVLSIARSSVCRKIQDVKWECEPILSTEEFEALDKKDKEQSIF